MGQEPGCCGFKPWSWLRISDTPTRSFTFWKRTYYVYPPKWLQRRGPKRDTRYSHSSMARPANLGRAGLFQNFPPPPPSDIVAEFDKYIESSKTICYARAIFPDSPILSLYRLYDYVMLDHAIGMLNEIEYFWMEHTWKVSDIPDPKDKDPGRYAALAAITEELVASFNNKISLGVPRDGRCVRKNAEFEILRNRKADEKDWETAPPWALVVPPLKSTVVIPNRDRMVLESLSHEKVSKAFKAKNILIKQPGTFFM